METCRSNDDRNDSWHADIERLYRGLEPDISFHMVRKAFTALKQKWQTGDETINVSNMALYLNTSECNAQKIIDYYESQHLCTKFKLT